VKPVGTDLNQMGEFRFVPPSLHSLLSISGTGVSIRDRNKTEITALMELTF
jgi:hypothetical protein